MPTTETTDRPSRYDVLAASDLDRDMAGIERAAEDLRRRITAFLDRYDEDTPAALWRAAGIPADAPGTRCLEDHVATAINDMTGFLWGLRLFIGAVGSLGGPHMDAREHAA